MTSTPVDLNILKQFASGSFQSELAYNITRNPNIKLNKAISVFTAKGSWETYNIKALTAQSNPAFKAYVLIPTHKNNNNINDIKVIFRGTDADTLDQEAISSININLEENSAGSTLWAAEGKNILQQFKSIIADTGLADKPIQIDISGHSQGGAFTQYFTTDLMHHIINHNIKNITHIQNNTFNSTGVDYKTGNQFKNIFPKIVAKFGKNFFKAHIGYTHGDPVQQTGENTIWEHIKPEEARIDMILIDKNLRQAWAKDLNFNKNITFEDIKIAIHNGITGSIKAHKNNAYFVPTKPDATLKNNQLKIKFPHEHYHNQTPAGDALIKKELTYKLYATQTILKPIKVLIHDMLKLFEKKPIIFSNTFSNSKKSSVTHDDYERAIWNNPMDMF